MLYKETRVVTLHHHRSPLQPSFHGFYFNTPVSTFGSAVHFFHEPAAIFILGNSFFSAYPSTPFFCSPFSCHPLRLGTLPIYAPNRDTSRGDYHSSALVVNVDADAMQQHHAENEGCHPCQPPPLLAYLRQCAIILLRVKELSCLLLFSLRSTTPVFLKVVKQVPY